MMKCAALSAPSASIEPGQHLRLVGDDRDRMAAEAGQRADHRPAELGLHLEPGAGVDHDVDHVAHVVDPPAVAGHDVEHLAAEPRARCRRPSSNGRVRPRATTGSSAGRGGPGRARRRRRRPRCGSARSPIATAGPPRSSLVTVSPSDSQHHRRTGGEDRRRAAVITEKSDIGATSAPWPADGPSTAVTSGTRPEQRACSEQVGGRPAVGRAVGAVAGAFEHHDQRHPVARARARRPGSAWSCAAWLIVPAITVKSSAATITGRPSIWPEPSTIASAGHRRRRRACRARGTSRDRGGARSGRGRRACRRRGGEPRRSSPPMARRGAPLGEVVERRAPGRQGAASSIGVAYRARSRRLAGLVGACEPRDDARATARRRWPPAVSQVNPVACGTCLRSCLIADGRTIAASPSSLLTAAASPAKPDMGQPHRRRQRLSRPHRSAPCDLPTPEAAAARARRHLKSEQGRPDRRPRHAFLLVVADD